MDQLRVLLLLSYGYLVHLPIQLLLHFVEVYVHLKPETVHVFLELIEISGQNGGRPPGIGAVKLAKVHPVSEGV